MSERAPRIAFAGLALDAIGMTAALDWLRQRSADDAFAWVVTPNVDHCLRLADASPGSPLHAAYADAGLCLCDSRVLSLLARACGRHLPVVTGSDLVLALLASLDPGQRVLLVGGDAGLAADLAALVPRARVSAHCPPMGLLRSPDAMAGCVEAVLAARADYVFLAVGSPQQELLAAAIARHPEARGTALCIGAAVEFATARKRRAPRWMQRLALEWLHRLIAEPRRLARRYLLDGPRILGLVVRGAG